MNSSEDESGKMTCHCECDKPKQTPYKGKIKVHQMYYNLDVHILSQGRL